MKLVIIDSSSAILLQKCRLIPALLKCFKIVIPSAVFSELSVSGYDGADLFCLLCATGDILIREPDEAASDKFSSSLHIGERKVISLFREGKGDFIIIDDGKGSAFCRDNNIPYINAILTVKILYFKSLITEKEYTDGWNWLLENARYSEHVKTWAKNADEQKLSAFF